MDSASTPRLLALQFGELSPAMQQQWAASLPALGQHACLSGIPLPQGAGTAGAASAAVPAAACEPLSMTAGWVYPPLPPRLAASELTIFCSVTVIMTPGFCMVCGFVPGRVRKLPLQLEPPSATACWEFVPAAAKLAACECWRRCFILKNLDHDSPWVYIACLSHNLLLCHCQLLLCRSQECRAVARRVCRTSSTSSLLS